MSKIISIIIPTLNEQAGVIRFLTSLQSIRTQCELIVVDGGSNDNTKDLALEYVDKVITSAQGRAVQMNTGAVLSSTPILLFLHADTILPHDAVEQIQYAVSEGYSWGHFDVKLSGQSKRLAIVAWMMNRRSRWTQIATGDQALFIVRRVFEQLGGFTELSLMEDIDFSSRLKRHSRPYCINSKVITSSRRWLDFGIIKTITLMWWLRLQFYCGVSPVKLAYLYKEGVFWKK